MKHIRGSGGSLKDSGEIRCSWSRSSIERSNEHVEQRKSNGVEEKISIVDFSLKEEDLIPKQRRSREQPSDTLQSHEHSFGNDGLPPLIRSLWLAAYSAVLSRIEQPIRHLLVRLHTMNRFHQSMIHTLYKKFIAFSILSTLVSYKSTKQSWKSNDFFKVNYYCSITVLQIKTLKQEI